MSGLLRASDGLVARELQPWTPEKLWYIERYLDIFCRAMKGKWSLVYADLLAGPGLCRDPRTGIEQPGSPLLALQRPEFERLFLNDIDPNATRALASRTTNVSPERLQITTVDCNTAIDTAREYLFPGASARTSLGLAVIDPTAFQMSYESIARLTDRVKLDLIIVVMTGYITRLAGTPEYERPLDAFFGTPDWRQILDDRRAGEPVMYRRWLDLYEQQLLRLGYAHVNDDARILNSKNSTIYHLVFASKHPRGAEFFQKISRRTYQGQRRLL